MSHRRYRLVPLLGSGLLLIGPVVAQTPPPVATPAATEEATPPVTAAPTPAPAVYVVADVMPSFPGGLPAQVAFLREKLHYPDQALQQGISGKVLVQFVVDERGHLLDPTVVRGLGAGLDEEALRLVRIMPWWTPGLVGGQPVKVAITLPIVFRALD